MIENVRKGHAYSKCGFLHTALVMDTFGLDGHCTELKRYFRWDGTVTITTRSMSQITLLSTLQAAWTARLSDQPKNLGVKDFFGNAP